MASWGGDTSTWRHQVLPAAPAPYGMAQASDAPPVLEAVDWSKVYRDPFTRCFLPDQPPSPQQAEEAVECRRELCIRIEDDGGRQIPPPVRTFEELQVLPQYVLEGLRWHGIQTPMPIQAQSLPLVLSGRNVIGLAQTGSGKTLAFLLPAIVQIESQPPLERNDAMPIALVLAPTRELAVQISEEATKVLHGSRRGSNHRGGVWSVCLYGGASRNRQMRDLYGCQIVVATPGRLRDLLSSRALSLKRVTYFTLDEADRMLDLGFQGDVTDISSQVRPERQVLFFSATWLSRVQELAKGLCEAREAPVRIAVGQKDHEDGGESQLQARAGITQQVVVLDYPETDWQRQAEEKAKILEAHLDRILSETDDSKVLVFVNQKGYADELCNKLWDKGYKTGAMHSGKAQEARLNTLHRFRKGETRLLIATDVLGRGIDIPSVSHVIIFEMGTVGDYIHRIGRTARGKDAKGQALVFFEYYWKAPLIASELIQVLEASEQEVPEELRRIADEVAAGKRKALGIKAFQKNGADWNGNKDWNNNGRNSWKSSGDWNRGGGGRSWEGERGRGGGEHRPWQNQVQAAVPTYAPPQAEVEPEDENRRVVPWTWEEEVQVQPGQRAPIPSSWEDAE